MSRKNSKPPYRALAVSLASTALLLAWGATQVDGLGWSALQNRLLLPLLRLLLFIGIGLVVAQAIEYMGWTKKLAITARPLFRFANLGDRCGAVFSTAFFSGVAANAMLVDFFNDGKLSRRQVFLTNFINQFPAYLLHLPTTFFIVLPLTGMAGVLYFALTFLALAVRVILFALYGRFFVKEVESSESGIPEESDGRFSADNSKHERKRKGGDLLSSIKKKLPARFATIIVYVAPIYTAVYLIGAMGWFDVARDWLAKFVTVKFIPVEALSVVILSFVAEFSSGFAAAGALMHSGAISTKETVLALLIGNVIAFPIRALRHQLPHYMGVFSPGMGAQILLLGQFFRVASIVAVGAAYYVL